MAYGRSYNRRRLGGKRGNYASAMGLRPVPFTRKRKYPGTGVGAPPRLGRRVRPRMAGPAGLTRTRTKTKRGKAFSHGDNTSSSSNMIGGGFRGFAGKLAQKCVCPQTVYSNTSGTTSCSTGAQTIFMYNILPKTDLVACKTAANAGTATSNSLRLFIRSGKQRLHFRNCANTPARCWIYDVIVKRSSTFANPVYAWRQGLSDMGGGSYPETNIGVTPYRSPEFNRVFSINKVVSVNLEPGQEHQHTVRHKWNKVVNTVQFENEGTELCPGFTRYVMVVFHGTLVHGTDNVVSYAPIKIDHAIQQEYAYGWLEKNSPTLSVTNNFVTTLTAPSFMAESGDADMANINA